MRNTRSIILLIVICFNEKGDWKSLIHDGFAECMRVLKPNGTLIFKWNESEIKASEVLSVIPFKPLFGHTTGRQSKTIWMCFMKREDDE